MSPLDLCGVQRGCHGSLGLRVAEAVAAAPDTAHYPYPARSPSPAAPLLAITLSQVGFSLWMWALGLQQTVTWAILSVAS